MKQQICLVCTGDQFKKYLTCEDYTVTHESFDLVQCQSCGFVFTENAPDPESIGKYYLSEDYIAHSDTKKGLISQLFHLSRTWMLSQKKKLIEKQCRSQSKTILDYGCGTGYFLDYMKSHQWDVTGIEPSDDVRTFISENFQFNVHPPDHLSKLHDQSMNVITLWHVLEHVHDPQNVIQQLHRILSDDGRLIIALPNLESFDARRYKQYWAAYDVPRHLWHFSPDTFRKYIEPFGFSMTGIVRLPLDSFYVSLLSEKYMQHNLAFLRGMLVGKLSWMNSWFDAGKCSSVIYLLSKGG